MRIATNRLLIREFEQGDLAGPFTPLPEGDPKPIAPFDFRRPDKVRAQIKGALESASEVPRQTFDFAVLTTVDRRVIGRAGWQLNPDSVGDAMVWFITDPSSWNQGLASEGARGIVEHCFGSMHRIWAECDPRNTGAVQLLEGLGMRKEAHFVENSFRGGRWYDSAVYALLQREWRERRGPV